MTCFNWDNLSPPPEGDMSIPDEWKGVDYTFSATFMDGRPSAPFGDKFVWEIDGLSLRFSRQDDGLWRVEFSSGEVFENVKIEFEEEYDGSRQD